PDAARSALRGLSPDQEPAIGPIGTAVATLDLVSHPGADRTVPGLDDALPILRVDVIGPSVAQTPLRREAGQLVPPPVEVSGPAIGPRGPDQLGQGLRQRPESPLAAAEGRDQGDDQDLDPGGASQQQPESQRMERQV